MPGEMPEQVAAQVAGNRNEGVAGDPARHAPQQVVRRNQRRQQKKAQPGISGMGADVKSPRQGIDENLHGVLRAYRAGDGRDHRDQDCGMGNRPLLYVAGEKRKRAIAIATSLFHFGRNSPVGCARATTNAMERENRLRSSAGTRSIAIIVKNLTARTLELTEITVVRPELRIAVFRSMQASASLATRFRPRNAIAPASGRVSGSSSQTRARPQAAMDARLKNATLLPK